jgi:hypothetical protein
VNGLALLAFVIYLYLPHVTFKTAAHLSIDLGRKRDASQIEEFLFAAIPSTFFNVAACVIIWTARALPFVDFRSVDVPLTARILFAPSGYAELAKFLSSFERIWATSYVVILLCVAWILGSVYGSAAGMQIVWHGNRSIYPWISRRQTRLEGLKFVLVTVAFTFGHMFYNAYHVWIARWSILRPFVFIKARDSQLLHGRFKGYTTTPSGEIESITLTQVSRYTRRSIRESIADGENPIRGLSGELVLKWSEVLDVNEVPPMTITKLIQEYDSEIEKARVKES